MADTSYPLLALHPELRNRIWGLVLESHHEDDLDYKGDSHYEDDSGEDDSLYEDDWQRPIIPQILQVKKLVRAETTSMYYGQAILELTSLLDDHRMLDCER
ncbi:hypothetical protein LTR53_000125 [Teratosphaeriaceae sp. CCFEE 6253]|nr:hypothetical protein LTR53_000125 [Teratosphaeriaceae sp. CCFEE 6253]